MYHFSSISKARSDDIAALEALVKRVENAFVRAFLAYLQKAASDDLLAEIIRLLEQSRQGEIPALFAPLAQNFNGVIYDSLIAAARLETGAIADDVIAAAKKISSNISPVVGISFQPGNERAAALVQQQASRLVREISESTRAVVNDAIVEGQLAGSGPRKVGQTIQQNIGLTERQLAAVKNYRRLLEEGSKEALTRDLRDKRTDPSVLNAKDKPLTPAQIDKMVEAYKNKYVRYRADTIARTEATEAINNGRTEALRQSLEQAGLGDDAVERTWRAVSDKRTRFSHTHAGLNGKKVIGIDTPFVAPDGSRMRAPGDRSLGASASQVVNCRCTTVNRIILPE